MTGRTVSHYRLLEKLGEGGMGVVYRAEDVRLERVVAIKFLSKEVGALGEEDRRRFYQEARAASLLDHPNIETIYEIDEADGEAFIVMGYLDGGTLQRRLQSARLTVPEVLDLAVQLADGLAAAHERGIVHRDVKPANVMVTSKGQVRLVDFGLAKLRTAGNLTQPGTTLGTIAYMSPEQIQKKADIDPRADAWSFGVLLYEMLTGEPPFKGEDVGGLLHAILQEEPPRPSVLDRRVPPSLDSVVARLLQKDREKRHASMEEVARDLRAAREEVRQSAQAVRTKAIAVLPFGNISADRENDYFSDGLTEELIANLSRLKDIRVVSRTSSMQYKGTNKDVRTIGRELGVRYVVEGSVRKFQDNIRITAQLVDVESDAQVWAETFKGKLADVFDIQEQVSRQIVDALMVKLSPTEKVVLKRRSTDNPEAFDCNLRARAFLARLSKSNLQYAIQLFRRAIELDARYAGAYAGLGEAYSQFYQLYEKKPEWLDRAMEASLEALMYDASLSDAHAALSFAHFNKRAYADSLAAAQKAVDLDPDNITGNWLMGRIYHTLDRDREAVALLERVLRLNPEVYTALVDLEACYSRLGDGPRLEEVRRRALEAFPRYLSRHPDDGRAMLFHATFLGRVGRREEALEQGASALRMNPDDALMLYNGACLYSLLGEKDLALQTLRKAVDAGYAFLEWIQRDPDFESIRGEPGYLEIVRRLGG